MTGKRFNPFENPPNASSSDEDDKVETDSLGGNSSSEEETDDDSFALKTPEKQQASDPESGSDEETKKVKSSTKKRSLSETDGGAASTDAKKVKSRSGEESKKTYFQRVWSEEDEIAALQGLIDYKNNTGVSPYDDTNAFYLSVKESISFDVSKAQVLKKLRGLKNKYENNLGKERNGEELTCSKAHDRKVFDLSKFVWGADGVALDSAVKSNGKSKKSSKTLKKDKSVKLELGSSSPSANGKSCEDEVMTNKGEASSAAELDAFENSGLVKALTRIGMSDFTAQSGWSMLASEDKKRFEEQWEVVQRRGLELCAEKRRIFHVVATMMAEAFRPNP